MRGQVHLVLGPVGAGKTTFARRLARRRSAVALDLDQWMATLFRPDRPDHAVMAWYAERVERCVDQIWRVSEAVLAAGTPVVLELGLVRRTDRQRFFDRIDDRRIALTIHVLEASRAVRRVRVAQRNRTRGPTFSMEVPVEIFELASDLWEPVERGEIEGRHVHFVRTDGG